LENEEHQLMNPACEEKLIHTKWQGEIEKNSPIRKLKQDLICAQQSKRKKLVKPS
jgi:hypothetical protein